MAVSSVPLLSSAQSGADSPQWFAGRVSKTFVLSNWSRPPFFSPLQMRKRIWLEELDILAEFSSLLRNLVSGVSLEWQTHTSLGQRERIEGSSGTGGHGKGSQVQPWMRGERAAVEARVIYLLVQELPRVGFAVVGFIAAATPVRELCSWGLHVGEACWLMITAFPCCWEALLRDS